MFRIATKITIAALLAGLLVIWLTLSKDVGIVVMEDSDTATERQTVSISVAADGTIQLDGKSILISELADEVTRIVGDSSGTEESHSQWSFVISIDQNVDYRHVIEVMDELSRGGATDISIAAY